jgi:transposase-like protein
MTNMPNLRRPGPARDRWLRRRYLEESASVVDLAGEAGVRSVTIYRWLERAAIPLRPRASANVTPARLAELYAAGPSLHRLARETALSRSTVLDRLAQHGALAVPTDPRAQRAAASYLDGRSLEEVAQEVNASRRKVTLWLRALQVPIRRPGRPPVPAPA